MQEERKICTELYRGEKKCKYARMAREGKKAHVYCIHPERFSEMTNVALRCSNCTDKLCTQYCQKLR